MSRTTANNMDKYLFFVQDSDADFERRIDCPASYTLEVWRPTMTQVMPRHGARSWGDVGKFLIWWFFAQVGIFSNRDYAIILIRKADIIVHRSLVTPRYFRFPFMAQDDLQIGDVWTAPEERGNGLAGLAISAVRANFAVPGRRLWWITNQSNESSVRVARKAGFELFGSGQRVSIGGIRFLGSFRLG